MEQKLIHKHYVGQAHHFSISNTDPLRPDVTILKTFFIDDTVNANDWQATWEGLKLDADELLGIPLVLQEDLEHPKFSVQKFFDRGTIFDYDIDEANHKIMVYARITDPTIVERIKAGELEYVSPAVIPRGSEYMETVNGVDVLNRTLPLHLAIVGNPAYGPMKAKMTHLCSGDGKECHHRLKQMTASAQVKKIIKREHELLDKGIPEKEVHEIIKQEFAADLQSCVSKKIPIIMDEKPNMSRDQAVAIAYSMCREGTAQNGPGGDGDGSPGTDNTGIKSRLRILNASLLKTASVIQQMKTGAKHPMLAGKEGEWIFAKGQDVFVAKNQSLEEALLGQCGCAKLGAAGKVSKEKANYHKTESTTKNCHSCRFYHEDDKVCEVVDGTIEEYYISDLWQPKK